MADSLIGRLAGFLCVAFLLDGCGNAYERLDQGEWQTTGEAVVPVVKEADARPEVFRASVVNKGSGREVRASSVVRVDVVARSGSIRDPQTLARLSNATGWVWIGRAEAANGRRLADLGSDVLRASVVGMREGGRLAFHANPARMETLALPNKGFLLAFAYKPNWRQLIPAGGVRLSMDPDYAELIGEGDYELSVSRVCEGRLTRKQATLKQWGFVFNWGDAHYNFAREGLLEWVALDVDCGRGERLRFEKGPAHGIFTPGYRDNPLLSWQESYENATKPGRFF